MLASIRKQGLKNYEIILADGHSDSPPDSVLEAFADLPVRLIQAKTRQYPLASRLAGFRVSQGRLIYFADSDDELFGKDAFATHLEQALACGSDIFQFRAIERRLCLDGKETEKILEDAGLGPVLRGREIFKTCLRTRTSYPNLWSKIYSRSHIEKLVNLPVLNHPSFYGSEDRLFNTVSMFYARHYVSSQQVGYVYYYAETRPASWAIKAIPSYVLMLGELLPFLAKHGADKDDLEILRKKLVQMLTHYTRELSRDMVEDCSRAVDDDMLDEILRYSSPEAMLKGLILGSPAWDLSGNIRKLDKLAKENIR